MALRNIVEKGDSVLNKNCRQVVKFDDHLHVLIDDLKETLAASGGLGLAAPQVGVLRRVCIVINDREEMIELVNPEIIESDGEITAPEGCLSLPGKFGMVTRPKHVRVRAQNRDGEWFEAEGSDMTARCFCHEFEHLDGHLFDEHCDRFLTDKELDDYYEKTAAEEHKKGEGDKE
ncbi:MAG: peptide deformylase [Oscillospiraceae bacterium]|nr:peptide deformylase [Oscillospiraceae bacterium]